MLVCCNPDQILVTVSSILNLHPAATCANEEDREAAGMLLGSGGGRVVDRS